MEEKIYYCRLTNLLYITCSNVMRALVSRLIRNQDISIEEYVQLKKPDILKTQIGLLHHKALFPTRQRRTDIQRWSLQLLFFIAEDIVRPEPKIAHAIDMLRHIRNDFCHGPSTYVSSKKYEKNLRMIVEIKDKLLQIAGDDNITQDIATQTEEIIDDKFPSGECLETLMDWLESDKVLLEQNCASSKEMRIILDYLKDIAQCERGSEIDFKVPDIKLVLNVKNIDTEQEHTICRRIVDAVNSKVSQNPDLVSQSDAMDKNLSKIVEEMVQECFTEAQVVKADLGCVIITIKSRTFVTLERLLSQSVNGKITKTFDKLQSYLRKTYHNRATIDVMLPEYEFWNVIRKTVGLLEEDYTPPVLTLALQPQTIQGLVYAIGYVSSGKQNEKINRSLHTHVLRQKNLYLFLELDFRDLHIGSADSGNIPIKFLIFRTKLPHGSKLDFQGPENVPGIAKYENEENNKERVVFRPQEIQELVNNIEYVSSGKLNEDLREIVIMFGQHLELKDLSIDMEFCELDIKDLQCVGSAESVILHMKDVIDYESGESVLCTSKAFKRILQRIYKKSNLCKRIISAFSDYIKSLSQSIVKVTACYKPCDTATVVFLVIFDRRVEEDVQEKLIHFDVHFRQKNSVNGESKVAFFKKGSRTDHFNKEEDEKVKRCIAKESKILLQTYSNITMISPNNVKSVGFCSGKHKTTSNICIVLFVPVKGLIPISEKEFPPMIGNYTTDVMEGTFSLFGQTPGDYHQHIKTGCQITCKETNLVGTVGPFVYLEENKVGFITSAHTVCDPNNLKHLPFCDGKSDVAHLGLKIYQPSHMDERNYVGQVKQLFVTNGDENGRSSIEVAVVELINREIEPGIFPECSFHSRGETEFCNSKEVYTGDVFSNPDDVALMTEVVMFGSQSGASTGLIYTLSPLVPFNDHIRMINQILVKDKSDTNRFAEPGDSGALVFTRKCNGSLKIIGLLVGGTPDLSYIVTPIWEIINTIGYSLLKCIPDVSVQGNNANELTSLRKTIEEVKSNLGKTNENIESLERQLNTVIDVLNDIKKK